MRRYETIFIADPDLQEDARKNLFDKFTNLLVQENGILVDFDDWGNRKLAYEIKKKARGHYVCMTYGGDGALVNELERNFRLDDKIMKFMTVLLEKNVKPSDLEQEIAAAAEPEEDTKPATENTEKATEEATEEATEKTTEDVKADTTKDTETADDAQEEN